ncbi:MAG: NAD(P)-dependent oxidoreductase, partial [Kofleriaceae bacterium]
MRLLYCGSGWLAVIDEIARRLGPGFEVVPWDRAVPLTTAVADVDVVLPSNAPIGADVIAAAHRLRLIQQPAAGYEGIDLVAARAREVPVCNAPGTNQVAVAEAAILLLLMLARRVPEAARAFAAAEIGAPVGRELAGRVLGIVGAGRTGRALRDRATALGLEVRVLDRAGSADPAARRAFFAGCELISLHCPLTDATRGLVDDDAFAAMPAGAIVVNVARGAVIDRGALERALAGGRLGGVGLDVFWHEPWDPTDPLYADPRVVVLPHVAGSTQEAMAQVAAV